MAPLDDSLSPDPVKLEADHDRGRGRSPSDDKDIDGLDLDGDDDVDGDGGGDGGNSSNSEGPARKRRRSRKGLDKKFECPEKGCGKSYSRAEHLYVRPLESDAAAGSRERDLERGGSREVETADTVPVIAIN